MVLLAALLTSACSSAPTSPEAVLGTPFELRAGETSALPNGLTLTFHAVRQDSRCPIDAICVSAGDAIVAISVMRATGTREPHDLHTDRRASSLRIDGLTLALTELRPYPRSDRQTQPGEYVATFLIN
jgi:hypothetical protein